MDAVTQSIAPIVLAREPGFRIGPIEVRPETCELIDGDRSIVVEPRVMQVLVALHQASGHVVSRDDLLMRCWAGRIVGDDAIHRVISRLRHEAEQSGGHFRIDTITKVGYRLLAEEPSETSKAARKANGIRRGVDRRMLIGGAGGFALLTATGFGIDRWRNPPLPAEARRKIEEGRELWKFGTLDAFAAAQSAFRAAADIAPGHSEPWSCLALAYAYQSQVGDPSSSAEAERNARSTAARALEIDPDAPEAHVALIALDYTRQANLASIDRRITALLRQHPRSLPLHNMKSYFLGQVGRSRDALAVFNDWSELQPDMSAIPAAALGYLLFNVGRVDEADRHLSSLLDRWPRHVSVWFTMLKTLMYSGRYDRALAMLDDVARRPVGIPEWNFDLSRVQIRALSDPLRYGEEGRDQTLSLARRGTGFAENGILFFSAQRLVDEAFAIADALYAGRGFQIGPRRFTSEQGHYDNRRRRTAVLFERITEPLRSDPRFTRITTELGLEDYWRTVGVKPDYRA